MRKKLLQDLNGNRLTFEQLAYVYCKKTPRVRKQVRAITWDSVENALQRVLREMLKVVLLRANDDDCYAGRYAGTPVALVEEAHPDVPQERRTLPVVDLLEEIVQGRLPAPVAAEPAESLSPLQEAMKLLVWKYLSQNNSQAAVLCLVTFLAPWQGQQQRFVFLTQVNLEGERPEAMIDEETGIIRAEVFKNVFEKPSLLKGALYPHYETAEHSTYESQRLWIHNQRTNGKEVVYWPGALECRRPRLSATAERGGVAKVIRTVVRQRTGRETVKPAIFAELTREAVLHGAIGPAQIVSAARQAQVDMPEEAVRAAWQETFPSPTYEVNGADAFGAGVKRYEVQTRELSITNISPNLLARIRVVRYGQQRFLMIPVDGPVPYRTEKEEIGHFDEDEIDRLEDLLRNRQ